MNLAAKNAKCAKKTWPMVRLGDIGTITRGSGIKRSETVERGRPCLRYGEIYTSFNVILDKPKSFVPQEVFDRSVHIKHGDLVFTLTGENTEEIAKTLAYLGDEEIAAGGDLAVWANHGCDPMYLAYLMYSPALIKAKADASNGQIIVHASVRKIQDIQFPLPPLPVQREIVARLEKELGEADALAAQFKGIAENADAEFKAELDETFKNVEGEKVRLGDVCENLDSKRIPITKSSREPGPYPYYGASGIVDYVKDYIFDGRYLLVSEDGANLVARATPIAFSVEGKIWVNNHAHILAFQSEELQNLVEYYFAAISVADIVTGAAQPKLTQKALNDIELPLPILPVQRAIVAKLDSAKDKCEKLKVAAERGLRAAEDLRTAILAEAFEQ